MKPQFWSIRMFAALWGLVFAQLAPALGDTQITVKQAAERPKPLIEVEWSNMIGGDLPLFLHAIPEAMKMAQADEDEVLAAKLIIKAIELIGEGEGHFWMNRVEWAEGEDEPKLDINLSLDLGDKLPDLQQIIQAVIEHESAEERLEQVDVEGVAFTELELNHEFYWGDAGSRFLFSTTTGGAKELVADAQRKTPGASNDLERVRGKVRANPAAPWKLSMYVDLAAVIDNVREVLTARDELPKDFELIVEELGLNGLRSMYIHSDDMDGGPANRTLLETDGTRKGLMSLWDQKPLERADLELIPQNACWAAAFNFDLEQTWTKTRETIEAIDPNAAMQIDAGVGMVAAMFGIDPVHQILPAFGDTWVLYDAPDHGGALITGAVLVAEVDGPDALGGAIDKLRAMANPMLMRDGYELAVKETTYKGYTIKYLVAAGLPIPIAPAAAYVDGRVIVGLSPQVVKRALHQADPALRTSSILDNADVKKLAGDPSGEALTFYYMDVRDQAASGYRFTHLLRTAAASLLANCEGETEAADLPTMPELLEGVENYVATCKLAGNDVVYEEKGSLFLWDAGMGNMSVASTAMAVSILLPSLARARELAKRAVSASNLRGLGMAMHIYANDYKGQFPPDVETLITKGMITRETLASPRDCGDDGSYVYISGQKASDDVRNVLAYERIMDDEGTVVLFLDGHAEWMELSEFHRVLKETKERLGERAKVIEPGASGE